MYRIWALLMLLGVVAASDPPPYVESMEAYVKAQEHLEKTLLNMNGSEPITDYKRHLAVIATALVEVSFYISRTCYYDYDKVYIEQLDKNFVLGLSDPIQIVHELNLHMYKVNQGTLPVQELINFCEKYNPKDCDYVIYYIVTHDPEIYKASADLILAVGKVAESYLGYEDTFMNLAVTYTEEAALINGAEEYKDFIYQMVDVLRQIYPDRPSC